MLEFVIGAIALLALYILMRRRTSGPLMPESLFAVVVTDSGIVCTDPSGVERWAAWPEVASIRIHTNDSGPWGIDVIWGFHDLSGEPSLLVPGGATGEEAMLTKLQELPGWNDEQVVAAMGCASNREFLCWKASTGDGKA